MVVVLVFTALLFFVDVSTVGHNISYFSIVSSSIEVIIVIFGQTTWSFSMIGQVWLSVWVFVGGTKGSSILMSFLGIFMKLSGVEWLFVSIPIGRMNFTVWVERSLRLC